MTYFSLIFFLLTLCAWSADSYQLVIRGGIVSTPGTPSFFLDGLDCSKLYFLPFRWEIIPGSENVKFSWKSSEYGPYVRKYPRARYYFRMRPILQSSHSIESFLILANLNIFSGQSL